MAGNDSLQRLVRAARKAREGAYSPYSGVKIGAAVLSSGGSIHTGANVENVSYGLSCCAERTALFSAVAGGDRDIVAIAVVGRSEEFTRPCGACRQVMVEFNPRMKVLMRGIDGFSEDGTAESLLPRRFRPAGLAKR
jgi:cytidine deaminase